MNWGLFLGLVGFLLPLSLMLRVGAQLVMAGRPLAEPVQAMRVVFLLLLAVPTIGKVPVTLYATVGRSGTLGRVTEAFMVTPWGLAQTAFLLVGVVLCDLFAPRIAARLEATAGELETAQPIYLTRDLALIVICLWVAWMVAR